MFIGVDASRAVKSQKTGTEYYSQEIIKAIGAVDKKNKYILYSPVKPNFEFQKGLGKNFTWKVMPFPRLWSQIRLSWELIASNQKPNAIFEPSHTIPVVHAKNMVVTIHDLGFRYFTELYTPFEKIYHNFSAWFSAKSSAHIIAVSKYTKQDIVKNFDIDPNKITVIYHGYDKKIFNQPVKSELFEQLSINNLPARQAGYQLTIKKPYLYFIGRLERKKNLSNMLKTYQILKKNPLFKHQLVLAGKPGWGYKEAIKRKIEGVIETGYVDKLTHAKLLKNADIFFFPSLFEGFGMPLVESMACGVPVVASDITSIPEVMGDAGVLVNPRKPKEMAAAIQKLVKSSSLKRNLIAKGLARAKQFSWEKSATETLAILKKVGERYEKNNS